MNDLHVNMGGNWYKYIVQDGVKVRWSSECAVCGETFEVVTSNWANEVRKTCDRHHWSKGRK